MKQSAKSCSSSATGDVPLGRQPARAKKRLSRVVRSTFDTERLPPHLDCYSLFAGCAVAIEGQHRPYLAIFDLETDCITCDCDQFQKYGTCSHLRALWGGLWAWLSVLPPTRSLVACTQDWCTRLPTVWPLAPHVVSAEAAVV